MLSSVSAADAASQTAPTADARVRAGEALTSLIASAVRWAPRDMSLTLLGTLATLDRAGPQRITDLARVEAWRSLKDFHARALSLGAMGLDPLREALARV
jgi:hypothetical protein